MVFLAIRRNITRVCGHSYRPLHVASTQHTRVYLNNRNSGVFDSIVYMHAYTIYNYQGH